MLFWWNQDWFDKDLESFGIYDFLKERKIIRKINPMMKMWVWYIFVKINFYQSWKNLKDQNLAFKF